MTRPAETCTLPLSSEGPLDLRATLRPLHGVFATDGWWLPARTPEGPASLRIRRTREELVGEAWGDGASWLLHRLAAISGLSDDPSSFQTEHPVVGQLHRGHPGWRFGRTGLVFDALVQGIVGQKVTGKEAHAAMRGLIELFGDPAPGRFSGLRLPPDPERMAEAPYWEYHELHLERRRAETLRRVAVLATKINALDGVTSKEADSVLVAISGVGPWTVSKTLSRSHGDADQVDVGDFHLKHMVVYHLTGRPRGSDEEMLELLEPFRPHRGRVARLIHTLGHEPKFGPRATPRDITRM
ncbi:MAG TPA: DNA-3-methyladenine glycosylase 2 family protein [Acidimicrobiia bacterium]